MRAKVFVNKIDKNIKNNKELYHYIGNENNEDLYHFKNEDIDDIIDVSNVNVRSKLNNIFSSESFVYKSKIEIILKDGTKLLEDVIAIKDNNLITLNNTKINIDDILDIKKA